MHIVKLAHFRILIITVEIYQHEQYSLNRSAILRDGNFIVYNASFSSFTKIENNKKVTRR